MNSDTTNHPPDSPRNDEALLRSVLVDAARARDPLAGRNSHLDAEVLVAYHEGSLSEDDTLRAQDHLVACATCTGLLADLVTGFEADPAPASGSLAFEKAAVWHALQSTVGAKAPGKQPTLGHATPHPPSPRQHRVPWALAAVLLAAVAGLAWRVNELSHVAATQRSELARLEAPQAIVDIAYLDPTTRDDAADVTVAATATRPRFLLILTPPLAAPEQTYRVEIHHSTNTPHWSSEPLVTNAHGTLRLGLSRRFMPPGRYHVFLLDAAGARVDQWTLRVIDG